jgi:hypothetical protein
MNRAAQRHLQGGGPHSINWGVCAVRQRLEGVLKGCARPSSRCMGPSTFIHFRRSRGTVASLCAAPHSPPAAMLCSSRAQPWRGMPARLWAVAMRSPTHRRAARAGDIACSTRCQELERLTWSSPGIGNACLLHAPGNAACRRFELPWCSPCAGSVCLPHAPRNAACRH